MNEQRINGSVQHLVYFGVSVSEESILSFMVTRLHNKTWTWPSEASLLTEITIPLKGQWLIHNAVWPSQDDITQVILPSHIKH